VGEGTGPEDQTTRIAPGEAGRNEIDGTHTLFNSVRFLLGKAVGNAVYHLPGMRMVRKIQAQQLSPTEAIHKACEVFFSSISVIGKPPTTEELKGRGLLVHGDHRDLLGAAALIQDLSRRYPDKKIGVVAIQGLFPIQTTQEEQDASEGAVSNNVENVEILEVLPTSFGSDRPNKHGLRVGSNVGMFRMELDEKAEELRKTNDQSLARAVELLNEGNIVVIFPTAAAPITSPWNDGIAEIYLGVDSDKRPLLLPMRTFYNTAEAMITGRPQPVVVQYGSAYKLPATEWSNSDLLAYLKAKFARRF